MPVQQVKANLDIAYDTSNSTIDRATELTNPFITDYTNLTDSRMTYEVKWDDSSTIKMFRLKSSTIYG